MRRSECVVNNIHMRSSREQFPEYIADAEYHYSRDWLPVFSAGQGIIRCKSEAQHPCIGLNWLDYLDL